MKRTCTLASAAVVSFLVMASACAASEEEPSSGGTAGATTVRYIQPSPSMAYLPAEVALSMGYYEEEGIDIEVIPNAAQTTQAVINGEADIAVASTPQVLSAMAAGRPVKAIGVLTPNSPNDLVLSNETIAELAAKGVTPESSVAARLRALEGLTITLPAEGSTSNLTFRSMLAGVGLDSNTDLTLIAISDSQANVTTTREGQADGYVFSPPVTSVAKTDGFGERWLAFYEDPAMTGVYTILVIARPDYLQENPDAAAAFLRGTDRAIQALKSDPDLVSPTLKEEWFADLDQATFDVALADMVPVYEDGLAPVPSNVTRMVQLTSEQTEQDLTELTIDQIFDLDHLADAGIAG